MVDYKYKVHEYRGYALVKSTYGGAWRIHEIKNDEIVMFKELGFARTLSEAKKIIDRKCESGKKR